MAWTIALHTPTAGRRLSAAFSAALMALAAWDSAPAHEQSPPMAAPLDIALALGGDGAGAIALSAHQEPTQAAAGADDFDPREKIGVQSSAEEVPPGAEPAGRRPFRPITDVTVDATLPAGLLPEDVQRQDAVRAAPTEVRDPRLFGGWGESPFEWSAAMLCHGPLYFEEVNLERYGYQCHPAVQPFVSGAHFFLTVPTLPYQMTVHPPRECVYTLGHYRPGDRVPWQRQRLPWDARAAAVQAGVAVGLIFLIP
jgi:hypothetical protein